MSDFGGEGGSGHLLRAFGSVGPEVYLRKPLAITFGKNEYYNDPKLKYPRSAWRPDLLAQLVIPEFCETDWRKIDCVKDYNGPEATADEIEKLKEKFAGDPGLREVRTAEIMAQDGGLPDYFAHLLMLKSQHALVVIHMAVTVGKMVGVHFKAIFNRPRPQQIDPEVFPLIPPPQHPAYPSAHSLQSHLVAKALAEVVPGATRLLNELARRIAENREVAGVHYPTDTAAGEELAKEVFKRLRECDSYKKAVKAAKEELARDQPKDVEPWK